MNSHLTAKTQNFKVACPRVAWAIALRETAEPNKSASHMIIFWAKAAKNKSYGK